jgi:hypothetical protein
MIVSICIAVAVMLLVLIFALCACWLESNLCPINQATLMRAQLRRRLSQK